MLQFVFFVSENRDFLKKAGYSFLLPSTDIINKIINKWTQYELMHNIGVEQPNTYFIDDISKLNGINNDLIFPLIVKPVNLFKWKYYFTKKGFIVNNLDELEKILIQTHKSNIPIILQEIVESECTGNFETSYYYDSEGKAAAGITIQKLRQYPLKLGSGSLIKTTNNREIELKSLDILKSLNWIGFANLEFKYDIGKNKYLFIEINPRVWQQIDLAEKLNLNFPFLYFNTLTNKPNPPSKEAVNEKKWMDQTKL